MVAKARTTYKGMEGWEGYRRAGIKVAKAKARATHDKLCCMYSVFPTPIITYS